MNVVKAAIVLCAIVVPATARAQVKFPPDPAWTPLRCKGGPMTDRFQDQPGALDERDIVGNSTAAAAMRASDATNLYLRLRLEEDPAPGGVIVPFAWGLQFDLDGDLTSYEVMVVVDGITNTTGTVSVLRNTTTTLHNDPADPADLPAVATYPFAMNARTVTAQGSTNGSNADFFLDFAVPWSALMSVGLNHSTPTHVWAATSNLVNVMNGDVACQDAATGPARLDASVSESTTGDPTQDPAFVPDGPARIEGGGGCTAGGAGSPLFALALLALRRRRSRPPLEES